MNQKETRPRPGVKALLLYVGRWRRTANILLSERVAARQADYKCLSTSMRWCNTRITSSVAVVAR
jgi:hypothetical protein